MINHSKKEVNVLFSKLNLKLLLITLIILFSTLTIKSVYSQSSTLSEPSVCCEKTKDGAACVNTLQSNCAANSKSAPTSCQTTSYCRLGTCYDSSEGICMENTPAQICSDSGGTWDSREAAQVPQCQLGCCIIGDQAAFVPLVRCKKLASFFGLENNYRTDITSEIACIATAQSQDMGACVYEQEFERICKFTTRSDCGASEIVETVRGNNVTLSTEKKFYKDMLCSAEELNTACARETGTTCHQGKVYYTDSCGNRENVYSSDKDKSWNHGKVAEPDSVCSPNNGNNKNCGNCDYFLGTRCAAWDGLGVGKPQGSDYYCQRTECTDREGKQRMNGESWCVYEGIPWNGRDVVGSRYYREVCVDGKVRVEPCEDYRNEICIEGSISTSAGEFGTADCRVNRWQDCWLHSGVTEDNFDDCTNVAKRDCMWIPSPIGVLFSSTGGQSTTSSPQAFSNPTLGSGFSNPTARVISTVTGNVVGYNNQVKPSTKDNSTGVCVPNSPPGLNFWSGTSTQSVCSQASVKCQIIHKNKILGSDKTINEECGTQDWFLQMNQICTALGDCGGYVNYVGEYSGKGVDWKKDGVNIPVERSTENRIKGGFTGMLIKEVTGQEQQI